MMLKDLVLNTVNATFFISTRILQTNSILITYKKAKDDHLTGINTITEIDFIDMNTTERVEKEIEDITGIKRGTVGPDQGILEKGNKGDIKTGSIGVKIGILAVESIVDIRKDQMIEIGRDIEKIHNKEEGGRIEQKEVNP